MAVCIRHQHVLLYTSYLVKKLLRSTKYLNMRLKRKTYYEVHATNSTDIPGTISSLVADGSSIRTNRKQDIYMPIQSIWRLATVVFYSEAVEKTNQEYVRKKIGKKSKIRKNKNTSKYVISTQYLYRKTDRKI